MRTLFAFAVSTAAVLALRAPIHAHFGAAGGIAASGVIGGGSWLLVWKILELVLGEVSSD